MRKNKLENEMPKIPEGVHRAVLDALDTVGREESGNEMKNKSVMKSRRKAVVLAIVAAALMGTTALAAELIWNQKAVEEFNYPSGEVQQKTVDSGVASLPDISITDQGITVTAVQTLQDENRVYMLLRVDSEEAVIDGNSGFDGWKLHDGSGDEYSIFENLGAGFADDETGTLANTGYYVIDGLKNHSNSWNGKTMYVELSDFSYYTYENHNLNTGTSEQVPHKIAGKWKMEIHLEDVSFLSKTVPVNQSFECRGTEVTVNYVKISPISALISYEASDLQKIEAAEDEFLGELLQMEILDTQGNQMIQGYGGISAWNTSDGQHIKMIGLPGVVDMEQVSCISLGNGEITIDIP